CSHARRDACIPVQSAQGATDRAQQDAMKQPKERRPLEEECLHHPRKISRRLGRFSKQAGLIAVVALSQAGIPASDPSPDPVLKDGAEAVAEEGKEMERIAPS